MIVNVQHAPVIHHLLFVVTVLGHVNLPACQWSGSIPEYISKCTV